MLAMVGFHTPTCNRSPGVLVDLVQQGLTVLAAYV